MANGNDKDWLDVSTSLPEDNKGKDRNRELFHNKPFEVGPEGYTEEELAINEQLVKNIQGTQAIAKQVGVDNIMGSPMTGPSMDWMHHKFDIKTAAAQKYGGEGYDYEDEKSYQKYKKQSQGRSLNNIEHYAKMQELGYEASVKKYQDDLYENQSYLDMATNFVSKTIGNTLIHTGGGLVGTIYGATKALVTWDSEALFDNEVFTATDAATDYLNRRLVVHGDAEYYDIMNDPERREEMSLGSRFMSHPFKVLNDDVSSAISFVGGTVLTEVAASLLAAPTGGASLVAATARNGALLTRGFRNSVKVLRGLDKASDFEKARKIIETTQKYQKLLGTTRATMMGAGYEAGLIGRETRDQTLEQMKENYKEQYGSEPQGATLEKMEREAKEAGDMSYWMNMGLVGGSNFIQFGRLFNKLKERSQLFLD